MCIIEDFNADVKKKSEFGDGLHSFCQGASLKIADSLLLPHDSVAHVNDGSSGEYVYIRAIDSNHTILKRLLSIAARIYTYHV